MGLFIGCASHPGKDRELNEDAYLALAAPAIAQGIEALFLVADGMGGHQAGEVASGELIQTMNQWFSSSAYQRWVDYSLQREDYYAVVLKEVLEHINERICNMAASRQDLGGMGTTATVALLANGRLFIGHVGDSRCYLLREGYLQRLTQDHSWVAEQVQAGALTPEEAAVHPQRNVITRSLGNRLDVRVDRAIYDLHRGDILVLCTDGLTNVVSDAEIQRTVLANRDSQEVCESLVRLANERGGPDNITVLIARLTDEIKGNNLKGGRAWGPERRVDESAITQKIEREKVSQGRPKVGETQLTNWVLASLLVLLVGMAVAATTFSVVGKVFPLLAAVVGLIAGLVAAVCTLAGILIAKIFSL